MSNITVSSTTDSQEQVDAAADYDPEAPVAERPHTTITTTTDDAAAVDEAMYGFGEPHGFAGEFTQQAAEKRLPVESTTDPPEVTREESAKLREHQENTGTDFATGLPKGETRRQREATISRLLGRNDKLAEENEQFRQQLGQHQQQPQPQQQQPDAWAQAQAVQYSPQQRQSAVQEFQNARQRVAEQEKEAVQRYGNYTESIDRMGKETPLPPTSYLHLMMNTSNAPDVGYYLSKHPEVVAKLWGLETSGQGVRVIEEINHISSGLRFQGNTAQTGAGPAARRERQGPPPPYKTVGGASCSAGPNLRDDNLTYQQHKQLMNEEAKRRGRQW